MSGLPKNDELQFLDLRLALVKEHVCWQYQPRSTQTTLNHISGHSEIVITLTALGAAFLTKHLKHKLLILQTVAFQIM